MAKNPLRRLTPATATEGPASLGPGSAESRPAGLGVRIHEATPVTDLASTYLGAFMFERLAAAGRARELRPDGLARATALFTTPIPPYCPEGF